MSIAFVFLIITLNLPAQVNIICPKLVDSTLNYFYTGIDNPIKITGLTLSPSHKIVISGAGATILTEEDYKNSNKTIVFPAEKDHYKVLTTIPSDSCFIRIYRGKKEIYKKRFISKAIPSPKLVLANQTGIKGNGEYMSKDTLLRYPFLTVFSDCYLKECYRLISFEITLVTNTPATTFTDSITGNYLSERQIEYIKRMQKQRVYVTIESIRCAGPDGKTRKLTPLIINLE